MKPRDLPSCLVLRLLLPLVLFFATLAAAAQAQDFAYTTSNGQITITGYAGPGGAVTIPATMDGLPVTTIGRQAFYFQTGVTSVTIPSSVTSIGDSAFSYCASLNAITVEALNTFYSSVDGVLFDQSQSTLIQYPGGRPGSYAIPNGVTRVGDNAFAYSTSLTSVTIPNSVTEIGMGAFAECDLATIAIPNSVTIIGRGAFVLCRRLSSVTIPDSVATIGAYAFSTCISLTSITIPNSVTLIGDWAFHACASLASVAIPNSVTNIGEYAFGSCAWLKGICFEGNVPSAGSDVFVNANQVIVYYLPGTTGWSSTFADRPAVLWNPQALPSDPNFGVRNGIFGFTITGTPNIMVVVEASSDLNISDWINLGELTLANGSADFRDPDWLNHPARAYRLRSPGF